MKKEKHLVLKPKMVKIKVQIEVNQECFEQENKVTNLKLVEIIKNALYKEVDNTVNKLFKDK